jgi:hypothetical protein
VHELHKSCYLDIKFNFNTLGLAQGKEDISHHTIIAQQLCGRKFESKKITRWRKPGGYKEMLPILAHQ